jgi:hypothetical protein
MVGLQLGTPHSSYQIFIMYKTVRPTLFHFQLVYTAEEVEEALAVDPDDLESAAATDVTMSDAVQQQADVQPTTQQVEISNVRLTIFHKKLCLG